MSNGILKGEFEERINKCLERMKKEGISLMFVYGDSSHFENLSYLTNYRPVGGDLPGNGGYHAVFLLSWDGSQTLIIDREWYLEWAKQESLIEHVIADKQGDILTLSYNILKKRKVVDGRIEVDTKTMSSEIYLEFRRKFACWEIDEGTRIIANLRKRKSKAEINIISKGLIALGKAHDAAEEAGKEGVREIDIALEIRRVLANEGADYPLSVFVDAGRRSTIPLASPMATNYRLRAGDMVLVSIFCSYEKYCPGLDRSWVVGEASDQQHRLAEIELKTLEKAIDLVKPGVHSSRFMKAVYKDFAEPMLKEGGFSDYNLQGYVGHGTGLHFLEMPILWKHDPTVLEAGMVIHIEPGIYSKNAKIGGIRTADTILVTETGHINLTNYPRRIGSLA